MIVKSVEEYGIDLANSYVVDDRGSDIKLGNNVSCKTIFVQTGLNKHPKLHPDYAARDLLDAVNWILKYNLRNRSISF